MNTTSAPHAASTLEHLDPNTIDIGDNVRDDPESSHQYSALVASIRTHGVLVPCTAVRDSTGKLELREGQRRVLAARAAQLPTVPVYITTDTATDSATRTARRITEQIVTNDARAGLTESQRAKGIQQLLSLGMSTTKVAKSLTMTKTLVEAAAQATQSAAGLTALEAGQLTIEQAAQLAEFENDDRAIEILLSATTPGQFEHRVSELRQQAASRAARATAAEPYVAQGYTHLDKAPGWSEPLRDGQLSRLYDTNGNHADPDIHTEHPALWAIYLEETTTYTDTRTQTPVEEHEIDWEAEENGDEEPDYIHPRHISETTEYQPVHFCLDLAAAGLITATEHYQRRANGHSPETNNEIQSDEKLRRDKRKVLALNKLGAAAQDVRRAFITNKILARKTPPKGAALFIATQLTAHPDLLGGYRVMDTATELLGQNATEITASNDARATVILLGLVLGALEAQTDKNAWRSTRYNDHATAYLQFLHANGYELSEIETVVTGQRDADELFDSISEPAHPNQAAA